MISESVAIDHFRRAAQGFNTLTLKSGQRSYDRAITDFIDWFCSEPRLAFNRTVVLRYRIYLEQKQYAAATITVWLLSVASPRKGDVTGFGGIHGKAGLEGTFLGAAFMAASVRDF